MTGAPWIVCAFCTPDYRHWAEKLIASLEAAGAPHDVVETPKFAGSWERNTMAKPVHVLAAMDRHPNRVIVFVDADCQVLGDLSPLASLQGDIALNIEKQTQRGRGIWLRVRSGTLVVKPTSRARRFVDAWRERCEQAAFGEDDETAPRTRHPVGHGCHNPTARSKVANRRPAEAR